MVEAKSGTNPVVFGAVKSVSLAKPPRLASCPRREVGPLLTPTFSILEVGKGQFLPPLKPPLLAILGHGPANLRPTQTNPQKARGVRKFSIHFHVKMGKISLCNPFSNKLLGLERQLPLKIAPCARFSNFFHVLPDFGPIFGGINPHF